LIWIEWHQHQLPRLGQAQDSTDDPWPTQALAADRKHPGVIFVPDAMIFSLIIDHMLTPSSFYFNKFGSQGTGEQWNQQYSDCADATVVV
jgi:hypothetical protein